MPRLRVTAGPSTAELVPITVNSGTPHSIFSDAFEGQVVVYIKGFTDTDGNVLDSEYFHREDRQGITWSIQVQGRFLKSYSADNVMFGNTFDRPLKLPWGSGAALKFMKFIDPTLDHDLSSPTKPWALSPLIATMPHFSYTHLAASQSAIESGPDGNPQSGTLGDPTHRAAPAPAAQPASRPEPHSSWPPFPPRNARSIADDTSELHLAMHAGVGIPSPPRLATSDSGSSTSSGSSSNSRSSSNASSSQSLPLEVVRRDIGPRSHSSTHLCVDSDAVHKKKNRVSASSISSISSRLSETGKKERKKLEKAIKKAEKHDRSLQHLDTPAKRQAYFRDTEKRREIVFGPEGLITVDFCYGFIEFAPTLALRLPGGISFDLMHYWDGQPVRFVCCERKHSPQHASHAGLHTNEVKDGEEPWGRVLWCVCIELADDDGEKQTARNGTGDVNAEDID
ncbi:hypothetical protein EVG20_g3449 [Dentipellis fragilis]|uniref:Domain of unknown function at the cortex 1 domain-containing protein n=1 Tax=Dentipellis fragilis TaxID=205917 RepID=A0A4Y9Z2I2_9AGAM|nr:hypothetical protein EVG20_g3449 [Dentipellis fragilis]